MRLYYLILILFFSISTFSLTGTNGTCTNICAYPVPCPTKTACPATGRCPDGTACTIGSATCPAPAECEGAEAFYIAFNYQGLYGTEVSPQDVYWDLILGGVDPNNWIQIPAEQTICAPSWASPSFKLLVNPENQPTPVIIPPTQCTVYTLKFDYDASGMPTLYIYQAGGTTAELPVSESTTMLAAPGKTTSPGKLIVSYPLPTRKKLKRRYQTIEEKR